jgi:hypothetical protein
VAERGVGIGDDIRIPRMPFRLGDLSDDMMEEDRECVFEDLLPSMLMSRVAGLDFSEFFGVF